MGRRKPVGTKKKKQYLQEQRDKQREKNKDDAPVKKKSRNNDGDEGDEERTQHEHHHCLTDETGNKLSNKNDRNGTVGVDNLDQHTLTQSVSKTGKANQLTSVFVRISDELVGKRKSESSIPIDQSKRGQPVRLKDIWNLQDLGLPQRPDWTASTTPEELHKQEEEMFKSWLEHIHFQHSIEDLSPFEHNLSVWRQLWRVVERSDVLLILADVRNPTLHIPTALVNWIHDVVQKSIVIALTKIDLVDRSHVDAWLSHLKKTTNGKIHKVVTFSCKGKSVGSGGGVSSRKKSITARATSEDRTSLIRNARSVLDVCIEATASDVAAQTTLAEQDDDSTTDNSSSTIEIPTVGIIGHPNVGKSSLINAIVGHKVVSISRSCGHTKHLQTHFCYNEPGNKNSECIAEVCDCPGLVFPVVAINKNNDNNNQDISHYSPRHLFELSGLYPIPQVREAYSAIRLLAQHTPLEKYYNIKLDIDDYGEHWSPYAICGCLADKKGYSTSRGGPPDTHRAGLEILRDTVDGYVLFQFSP